MFKIIKKTFLITLYSPAWLPFLSLIISCFNDFTYLENINNIIVHGINFFTFTAMNTFIYLLNHPDISFNMYILDILKEWFNRDLVSIFMQLTNHIIELPNNDNPVITETASSDYLKMKRYACWLGFGTAELHILWFIQIKYDISTFVGDPTHGCLCPKPKRLITPLLENILEPEAIQRIINKWRIFGVTPEPVRVEAESTPITPELLPSKYSDKILLHCVLGVVFGTAMGCLFNYLDYAPLLLTV